MAVLASGLPAYQSIDGTAMIALVSRMVDRDANGDPIYAETGTLNCTVIHGLKTEGGIVRRAARWAERGHRIEFFHNRPDWFTRPPFLILYR